MEWYEVVENDKKIAQGDFFQNCPIVIPPKHINIEETLDFEVIEYNVTVLSQSCDLENDKLDLVLVSPVWPLKAFGEKNNYYKSSEAKEALRRGNMTGYHLLNKCELDNFKSEDFYVVDFRSVYALDYAFLKDFAVQQSARLRLCSPYREHLSQAFARFFMRVGLPIDIPPFEKKMNVVW